jgi:hypothetical protein
VICGARVRIPLQKVKQPKQKSQANQSPLRSAARLLDGENLKRLRPLDPQRRELVLVRRYVYQPGRPFMNSPSLLFC